MKTFLQKIRVSLVIVTIQVLLFNTTVFGQHTLQSSDVTISSAEVTTASSSTPYTLQDDDVNMDNGRISLIYYDFTSKNIIIPDTLDGQTVIEVDWTFEGRGIEQLQLPNTIKIIGEYAFFGNAIESI